MKKTGSYIKYWVFVLTMVGSFAGFGQQTTPFQLDSVGRDLPTEYNFTECNCKDKVKRLVNAYEAEIDSCQSDFDELERKYLLLDILMQQQGSSFERTLSSIEKSVEQNNLLMTEIRSEREKKYVAESKLSEWKSYAHGGLGVGVGYTLSELIKFIRGN